MSRHLGPFLLGWLLVACGGSSVDKELESTTPAADTAEQTPPPPEPVTMEPSGDDDSADAPAEGEARYQGLKLRTGDRVRLKRRVGTISAPGLEGSAQVEAATGKAGTISGIQDPGGLVEVTWDAQSWTIHGGYAWDGKETIEVGDLEGVASRSGGSVELEPFSTTIHMGYLELER
jgi:hypothetical protein